MRYLSDEQQYSPSAHNLELCLYEKKLAAQLSRRLLSMEVEWINSYELMNHLIFKEVIRW